VLNDYTADKNGYVTRSDATNVTFGSENRRSLNKTRFSQGVLTFKWDATERLTIDGYGGYEKSTYTTPYDDKFYMRAKGNLIADYGTDGRSAKFTYPGFDTTNPANYAMDNFYYRAFNNSSELMEGRLNLRYKVSPTFTFRAGAAYHKFTQDGADYFYDGGANGTTGKTRGTAVGDITDVFSNSLGKWLIGNYDKGFAKYNEYHRLGVNKNDGVGGVLQDIENVYTTSEETFSGYAQVDWDGELFGMGFRGNVGLRGYHTNTRSQGWIQGDSYAYLGTADVKGNYAGVLPAMNAVLELTDETLLRFAATQNLNRPSLGSLAAEGTAVKNEDTGEISVSRGNPQLKPFTDTTLDFSVEHYFGKVGLLSASVFHKWIKNFITSETLDQVNTPGLNFSQTGVPFSTIPGATANTLVTEFSRPVNDPATRSLTGVELAAQMQFTFLPGALKYLGFNANFTYVKAGKQITGISDVSYNATLYYETDKWSVRGSVSHRNRWYSERSDDPMSAGTRGFEGTTYFDASAYWNVTPRVQLTVNAINLTNEKDTQFWGQSRYIYNQTRFGTTYLAGVVLKY
jgi:TonB-dependent receptor